MEPHTYNPSTQEAKDSGVQVLISTQQGSLPPLIKPYLKKPNWSQMWWCIAFNLSIQEIEAGASLVYLASSRPADVHSEILS